MSALPSAPDLPRIVVVHCHMFKNAGSSLDWSLEQNFGRRFSRLWGRGVQSENPMLADLLRNSPQVCAVSGHKLYPPLPRIAATRLLPVFILRHPIERAYSVYSFERGQVLETPGSIHAKRSSFRDYIRWRMDPDSPPAIRDFQAHFLAGATGVRSGDVLGQARRTLRGTPLVATLELYDECMVLFESVLRAHFPAIDLAYVRQNEGRYRRRTGGLLRAAHVLRQYIDGVRQLPGGQDKEAVETRVGRILDMLGADVAGLLIERNRNDLRLYQEATSVVLGRLAALEGLEDRLAEFRARCGRKRDAQSGSRTRAGRDLLAYMLRLMRVRARALFSPGDRVGSDRDKSTRHPGHVNLAQRLAAAGIWSGAIDALTSGAVSPERWLNPKRRRKLQGTGLDDVVALAVALGRDASDPRADQSAPVAHGR